MTEEWIREWRTLQWRVAQAAKRWTMSTRGGDIWSKDRAERAATAGRDLREAVFALESHEEGMP